RGITDSGRGPRAEGVVLYIEISEDSDELHIPAYTILQADGTCAVVVGGNVTELRSWDGEWPPKPEPRRTRRARTDGLAYADVVEIANRVHASLRRNPCPKRDLRNRVPALQRKLMYIPVKQYLLENKMIVQEDGLWWALHRGERVGGDAA